MCRSSNIGAVTIQIRAIVPTTDVGMVDTSGVVSNLYLDCGGNSIVDSHITLRDITIDQLNEIYGVIASITNKEESNGR